MQLWQLVKKFLCPGCPSVWWWSEVIVGQLLERKAGPKAQENEDKVNMRGHTGPKRTNFCLSFPPTLTVQVLCRRSNERQTRRSRRRSSGSWASCGPAADPSQHISNNVASSGDTWCPCRPSELHIGSFTSTFEISGSLSWPSLYQKHTGKGILGNLLPA